MGLLCGAALTAAAILWLSPHLTWATDPTGEFRPFPNVAKGLFAPEPEEEARFLVAVAAPFVLFALVLCLGAAGERRRGLDRLVIAGQVALLVFVIWAAARQTSYSFGAPDFVPDLLIGRGVAAGGVLIGIVLAALLLWPPGGPRAKRLRMLAAPIRERPWIAPSLAAGVTAVWLLPAVVTDRTVGLTGSNADHLLFQFGDYLAAANGRTPLVDVVAWYANLLPILVAPALSATSLSFLGFSLTMCALNLVGLLAVYAALSLVTESRWLGLCLYVPFAALSFLPWHVDGFAYGYNGLYFAALPDRYLGPFLVAWLLARHLRRGSPRLGVVYFAAGLTLLNNFEFGATCLIALALATAAPVVRVRMRAQAAGSLLVEAAAGLTAALILVSALTLIRAGELPDPRILTYVSSTFAREGYGLLPMPTWGLHWAIYLTYVAALLVGAVRVVRAPAESVLTGMLLFTGAFGLLTGQYFAGRSDPTQLMGLFPSWGLALALLAWLVFKHRSSLEARPDRRHAVPALAVMIGFGVMVASIAQFPSPFRQIERLGYDGPAYSLEGPVGFVRRNTRPGEPVVIASSPLDHRLAERAGVEDVSRYPASILISERQTDQVLDDLSDAGGDKVFESYPAPAGLPNYLGSVLLRRGFRPVAVDEGTGLRLWVADQPPR